MREIDALKLFKCLADQSRLEILGSLMQEEMYVERLSQRLALTPATISFHLKKLEDAGLVSSRKEQYYTMYTIRKDVLEHRMIDVIVPNAAQSDVQERRDEEYRRKIIKTFFVYGKLVSIPAQRKKRRICLEEIAASFEKGKPYSEKEINDVIEAFHADYCTIRREMICEGIMVRNAGLYTRVI